MDADEFVLGEDVTEAARPRARKESAVLSVRLSAAEIAELEALADAANKSLSQIVREALHAYRHLVAGTQPTITVSVEGWGTFSTGYRDQSSYGVEAETGEELATAG
jgi:hypothetical protein